MPNLAICLTILRFALFGPRDPPTNRHGPFDVDNMLSLSNCQFALLRSVNFLELL